MPDVCRISGNQWYCVRKSRGNSMRVSIITATYNAAATIIDCLQSVAVQSFPPFEHIIVDGASTDSTLDIVKKSRFNNQDLDSVSSHLTSQSSTITRVVSEQDNGIYDAMNKGIALATGDVIGILNSDDFYASSDVLAKVAKVFEDPAVMSCYGDLEYVKGQGQVARGKENLKPQNFKIVRYWKSGTYTLSSWYWGWMPPHPTFFVRRSVYDQYGKFRLDLGSAADYEIMLRFLIKHQVSTKYIPEVLVRMRVGGASNVNFLAQISANRMDRKSWELNNLIPYPWTMICKPIRKIPQWFTIRFSKKETRR